MNMERRKKMLEFGVLFLSQMITGIIVFIVFMQFIQMKKKVEKIIKEIEGYILLVTEEVQEENIETNIKKSLTEDNVSLREKNRTNKHQSQEDAQTQLIQAVLGEYFL